MGREAVCECRVDGTAHPIKALLESGFLILRGDLKRRIEFSAITAAKVVGEQLEFKAAGEAFALDLGQGRGGSMAFFTDAPCG